MKKNLLKNMTAAIAALFIALLALPQTALAQSKKAYVVENGSTLTFYYDAQKYTRIGYIYDINQKKDASVPIWAGKNIITKVVFDKLFKDYRPTTTASWFYSCKNLETVEGIEYLNTEEVTDMSRMFAGCNALTALDVSKFNTAKVTNMSGMFGESALATLDLTSFNTANVTDMSEMFAFCDKLTSLNLLKFNTAKVTNMTSMFWACEALTTIYCNDDWTKGVVTESENMFADCSKLKGFATYDANKTDVSMANPISGYFTKKAVAYVVENGSTLTFYYDTEKATHKGTGITIYGIDEKRTDNNNIPAWAGVSGNENVLTTKAVFNSSFKNYRPTTTAYWFDYCTKLATFEGIENLNTEKVTDMDSMFLGCSALTSLDLSKFNTTNVTTMSSMFYGCSSLTSIDVTKFNTANVTTMSAMFCGCSSLKSLDVSSFNTANVAHMSFMFYNCKSLTSLNVSNFNTANAFYMTEMFSGCSALTSLNVSSFNTAKVEYMNSMFCDCSSLTSLDVSNFNTEKVINMYCMFYNCSALTTIYCNGNWKSDVVKESTSMFTNSSNLKGAVAYNPTKTDVTMANPTTGYFTKKRVAYVVENGSTLTFYYDTNKATRTGTVYGIYDKRTDDTKVPAWAGSKLDKNERTTKVVFDSSFKDYRPTTTSCWFCICKNLATIEGIENLNTEEVTDMSNMFMGCSALTSIDVTNFNTAKVTDMRNMFSACSALTTIYCYDNWNRGVVKESTGMFIGCTNLKGFATYDANRTDVSMANPSSGYFTRKPVAYVVENGSTLTFYYDAKKEARTGTGITIYGIDDKRTDDTDIPAWAGKYLKENERTTKAVFDSSFKDYRPTTTASWFDSCTKLETIEDIENLNTEEVTDMSDMFLACESLTSLDVSKFNTAKVTDMFNMFFYCLSLTSLDVSKFNTANVTDMSYMFCYCTSLTALDLSSFNTANVTHMHSMFDGCKSLTSLDVSNFNTGKVKDMKWMFNNCSALTTIYCNDDWTKGVVTESGNMFGYCTKLKGAVSYDATKTDVTMANPTTGYFTKKDPSGIDAATVDTPAARRGIYTLNGVRLNTSPDNLPAGIYVIDGRKVVKR